MYIVFVYLQVTCRYYRSTFLAAAARRYVWIRSLYRCIYRRRSTTGLYAYQVLFCNVSQKQDTILLSITLVIIDRFSNFSDHQTQ